MAPIVAFVDVERDEARRLAEQELADPVYEDEPPVIQRVLEWILRQLDEITAGFGTSLGGWGVLVVLIPIAIIVAIVLWRFGPMARRAARGEEPLFGGTKRSAAEYRRAADDAFDQGNWTASTLERFRAIIAGLEERDILADEATSDAGRLPPGLADRLVAGAMTFDDVRHILAGEPGRTADEAARDAGRLLPGLAERLVAGAVTFDDVRYGERAATRDEAVTMRELDRAARTARISDEPADTASAPAVPR